MMRRRKPVPPVRGGYPSGATPPSRMPPPAAAGEIRTGPGILRFAPDVSADAAARFAEAYRADRERGSYAVLPPPLRTPAELEAEHVERDLAARSQLAETLRPFDARKRRELLTWAIRELVDAPTAPAPKEPTP